MSRIILIVFVLVYAVNAIKNLAPYIEVCRCLKKIQNFDRAYKPDYFGFSNYSAYKNELKALIRYSPVIQKYCCWRDCKLSHNLQPYLIKERSDKLWAELLDMKYEQRCRFVQSLNPIEALKVFCLLPVKIVRLFGFNPRRPQVLLISIISWLISYLCTVFQTEIKALLLTVFQNFVHT